MSQTRIVLHSKMDYMTGYGLKYLQNYFTTLLECYHSDQNGNVNPGAIGQRKYSNAREAWSI